MITHLVGISVSKGDILASLNNVNYKERAQNCCGSNFCGSKGNLSCIFSLKNAGEIAFRTTEIASAAVLGAFFVVDVIKTGKDVTLRYTDTNEMRDHAAKLSEAQKNLEV